MAVERTSLDPALCRVGGGASVLGALVSVAAGAGFGDVIEAPNANALVADLASRPRVFWPLVHLGFVVGALLWVSVFWVLRSVLVAPRARQLADLALVAVIVGAALHLVDSGVTGPPLAILVDAAPAAGAQPEQFVVIETLLHVHAGLWAGVISFFHGLPFLLLGLALASERAFPRWTGVVGAALGAASLGVGVSMFLFPDRVPGWPYIVLAVGLSLWMILLGLLLWRRAGEPVPE